MKIIYEGLEPHGFNQLLVADDFEIKAPYTDIQPPVPNWKPKWTGVEWVELATEEEKYPPIQEPEPSELDLIRQENEELKQRMELSDEALLELADMIFNVQNSKGGE